MRERELRMEKTLSMSSRSRKRGEMPLKEARRTQPLVTRKTKERIRLERWSLIRSKPFVPRWTRAPRVWMDEKSIERRPRVELANPYVPFLRAVLSR